MAFAEQLLPASFRDVPFLVEAASSPAAGRRVVTHVFPQRNDVEHEDLGLAVGAISVEAVLIGDDVIAQAKRLSAELERPGDGVLVHPWLGRMDVRLVRPAVPRWNMRRGRRCDIALEFERAGRVRSPAAVTDTEGAVTRAADKAEAGAQAAFAARWSVAGAPDIVVARAGELSATLGDELAAALGRSGLAGATTWPPTGFNSGLDLGDGLGLARSVAATLGAAADLTSGALRLAADVRSGRALGMLARLAGLGVGGFGAGLVRDVATSVPVIGMADANQLAFVDLVRDTAAIAAARAGLTAPFESRQAAAFARDRLADALDARAAAASDFVAGAVAGAWAIGETAPMRVPALVADARWQGLLDLRGAVVADLTRRAADLAAVTTATPAGSQPVLLLAQNLYGDDPTTLLAAHDDLVRRNRVRHPLLVVGGQPLEALVR